MRILHLTDLYRPFIGGLERHVEHLAQEQRRRGHEVSVATLQLGEDPALEVDGAGVRVHRLGCSLAHVPGAFADGGARFHPTVPDPVVVAGLRRVLAAEEPEVVHATGWIVHSVLPLKRAAGVKLVYTHLDYGLACPKKTLVHTSGAFCSGPALRKCLPCAGEHYGRAKGAALTLGLKASAPLLAGIDAHVTLSRFMAGHCPTGDVPPVVVPSLIPEPPAEPAGLPRPAFLPPEDGYVMFVGAIGSHKGVDVLLEAHRTGLGARAPLVVAGTPRADGPTDFPDGVTVAHDVPNDQVLAAWARCSVAVVPSTWQEPFGQVAIEAMACGKPVVATRTGGLQEVVVDGETGTLVAPGDPVALRDAVIALLDDPERCRRYGAAGRERARRFTVGEVARDFDRVCEGVLA